MCLGISFGGRAMSRTNKKKWLWPFDRINRPKMSISFRIRYFSLVFCNHRTDKFSLYSLDRFFLVTYNKIAVGHMVLLACFPVQHFNRFKCNKRTKNFLLKAARKEHEESYVLAPTKHLAQNQNGLAEDKRQSENGRTSKK